jgi:hypothetical protein
MHGTAKNSYRLLVVKPEGKRQLERPGRRCGDNIETDVKETVWEDTDGINLAQGRNQWRVFVNTAMGIRVA